MRRERLRPVVRLLSAFAAVLCLPACITGSAGNGSVSGTASVTSTGKMEGIRVLIPELRRTATTGPDGKFRIADVPPGSYLVVAEDNAYLWQDRKSAIVSGGAETSLAFSLSFDGAVGTVVGAVPRSVLAPDGMTLFVHVRGNYAFLGDHWGGVPIVDVSDPRSPAVVSTLTLAPYPGTGHPGDWHMSYCTDDGNYLVVTNSIHGALFFDITDKRNPVLRHQAYQIDNLYGGIPVSSLIDYPYPVDADKNVLKPYAVAGSGNAVYVGGWNTLAVFDISNRNAPALVRGIRTVGEGDDLQVVGNRLFYCYVHTGIFDISSPLAPSLLAEYPDGAVGLAVSGNVMALSRIASGVEFVDIGNLSSMSSLGSVPGTSQGGDASWDGYFYAAMGDGGMSVYRADPATGTVAGMYSVNVTTDYAMNVSLSGDYAYVADKSDGLKIVRIR